MALALGTSKGSWGSSSADPIVEDSITLAANSVVLVLLLTAQPVTARGGAAPTFGGVAMSQAGTGQAGSAEGYTELWYLINPSLSSSTLSIPNTGAGAYFYTYVSFTGTGAEYFGTDQTGVTSGTPSCTVNSVPAGGACVSVLSDGTKNSPSARSHTVILENVYSNWSNLCQYTLLSGNITMSWTLTSDDVAMVMVAFREVVSAKIFAGTAQLASSTPADSDMSVTRLLDGIAEVSSLTPAAASSILRLLNVRGI